MSEPPSKIDKPDAFSRQIHQNENEENDVEFSVVLCHDLFFEVLQYGNRLQLTKLEHAGRKLHRFIELYFEETPFLLLNLTLRLKLSNDSEQQLKPLIELWNGGTFTTHEISSSDLTALPPFLRFDRVMLDFESPYCLYLYDTQSIADLADNKCILFENLLKSVESALPGSKIAFESYLEFLNYVRDRLLPICDKSCAYKFNISCDSYESGLRNVISSILQTPQLNRCSNAHFTFWHTANEMELQLPVNEISNWLHRKCDSGQKKSLNIFSEAIETQNLKEMINHLKEEFKKDKSPVPPYSFMLEYGYQYSVEEIEDDDADTDEDAVDEETLINKEANEEFSVRKAKNGISANNKGIIIERAAMKKKN